MQTPSSRWDTLQMGSRDIEGTIQERDRSYYARQFEEYERRDRRCEEKRKDVEPATPEADRRRPVHSVR